METRFEIYPDRADNWRWRLRARNGRIVATGAEGYCDKAAAARAVRRLYHHLIDAETIVLARWGETRPHASIPPASD